MLIGISNLLATVGNGGLRYRVKCDPDLDSIVPIITPPYARYGWVSSDGYPWMNFCHVFEDKVTNNVGWHYHEGSHFDSPRGLGTEDHTYSGVVCKQWAIDAPSLPIDTAACIATYLKTTAPNVDPILIPNYLLLFE